MLKQKVISQVLTNTILGIDQGKKIEEFAKADVQVKTIRIKENNLPKEDISFPAFKYEEIIEIDWDDSDFKQILERKVLFIFYKYEGDKLVLKKAVFWNMPYTDIVEAKKVWDKTILQIKRGEIVKEVTEKGIRRSYLPKKKENRVSHVRPHATNRDDTYPLPVADKLTGLKEYTKHCFWFNASFVRDEIYLK